MRIRLQRPSPALVVAFIALFVSMGGVSYGVATGSIDGREIRNGTITTKDLRNNEVRGADIRNSTIGGRDVALNTLGTNDIKESTLSKVPAAGQADSATTAGNSNALGGVPSSGFVRGEAPAFGPIALAAGYSAVNPTPPGIDIDALGYAHLRGTINGPGGGPGTAFTLPAGQRPEQSALFAVRATGGTATLTISETGVATASQGNVTSLDGVTFAVAR